MTFRPDTDVLMAVPATCSILFYVEFVDDARAQAQRIAQGLGVPYVDIDRLNIPGDVIAQIRAEEARELQIVPVKKSGDSVWLALRDLGNFGEVSQKLNMRVLPVLALETAISEALAKYYPLT